MEEERRESTDVKTASWPHVVLMGQRLTFSPVRGLAQSITVNSVIHSVQLEHLTLNQRFCNICSHQ